MKPLKYGKIYINKVFKKGVGKCYDVYEELSCQPIYSNKHNRERSPIVKGIIK